MAKKRKRKERQVELRRTAAAREASAAKLNKKLSASGASFGCKFIVESDDHLLALVHCDADVASGDGEPRPEGITQIIGGVHDEASGDGLY